MVTLDSIRKDMAQMHERDSDISSVEVRADSLDEALADAAVQFNTKVNNLEYEVLEKGFDGFLGIAKKPWAIRVYQNPDTIKKSASLSSSDILAGFMGEEKKIVSKDGLYYIHHFDNDLVLKVTLPEGKGHPVDIHTV